MKKLAYKTSICLILLICALAVPQAHSQILPPDPGEFGDAPEGNPAYPALGITGLFPTCRGGPAGAVYHANIMPLAWFGADMDIEADGNAGFCPVPPYEMDECYGPADNDGGLVNVSTYSIFQNQITLCSPGPDDPVGPACGTVSWGPAIDIRITNFSGNDALINVLFDWNQDGMWGGSALGCGGGLRTEHVIWNLPVPDGYVGNLSGLNPGQLHIGPNPGPVWVRFTIGDPIPMPMNWDGDFLFDTGETEDYLLMIDDPGTGGGGELGDAPEQALAYPNGIMGNFPTCIAVGPAGHIYHAAPITGFFGVGVDLEADGNQDDCAFINHENDECHDGDGDGGLTIPASYDLVGGSTIECVTSGLARLGNSCGVAGWGNDIDILIDNSSGQDMYFNVLADWDQDGSWGHTVTCSDGTTGDEYVIVDATVPAGFFGPASSLGVPDFPILSAAGYVWFRFTLSDTPVNQPDWTGEGNFGDGETEDYLLYVGEVSSVPGMPSNGAALEVMPGTPNPFNPSVTVRYLLARDGDVRITVLDLAGRRIQTFEGGIQAAGAHDFVWNGKDDSGRKPESGVYFIRVEAGGEVATQKVVMLK